MQINKNTYYQIPRYLIALIFSNKRTGKYQLNKTDYKNKFYFKVIIPGTEIILNVPFKAILKDNNKIKGIKGFNFNTATSCSSHRRGLCQVGNIKDCYAFQGEQRNKNDITNTGALKMNSIHQINLNILFNETIKRDKQVFNKFIEYLNLKIPYLRFNVNGDFKSQDDLNLLINICKEYTGTAYGYTARDDLDRLQDLQTLAAVNGSNKKYTNKYTCTFLLETYLKAILNGRECKGKCLNCCKCWTLKDTEIINLFHKKDADIILNTWINREFIIKIFKGFNINITHQDLTRLKGIYASINRYFKGNLKNQDINNIKNLLYYIAACSHYDIKDNTDLYNIKTLQKHGII